MPGMCTFAVVFLPVAVTHGSPWTPNDEKAGDTQYSNRDTNGRLAQSMTHSSPKGTWDFFPSGLLYSLIYLRRELTLEGRTELNKTDTTVRDPQLNCLGRGFTRARFQKPNVAKTNHWISIFSCLLINLQRLAFLFFSLNNGAFICGEWYLDSNDPNLQKPSVELSLFSSDDLSVSYDVNAAKQIMALKSKLKSHCGLGEWRHHKHVDCLEPHKLFPDVPSPSWRERKWNRNCLIS